MIPLSVTGPCWRGIASGGTRSTSEEALKKAPVFSRGSFLQSLLRTLQDVLRLVILALRRFDSAANYRELQQALAARSLGQLRELGIRFADSVLLELGSGEGGYSTSLAQQSCFMVASDLHINGYYHKQRIPFVQMDATRLLPFLDNSFDVVYCSSLIEHVERPTFLLAECYRVLRPGGILYLSFPPFYSLSLIGGHQFKPFHLLGERPAIWLTNMVRGATYQSYSDCYGDYGLFPLTIAAVRQIVQHSGLRIEHVFTRALPINTARLPGLLADLFTWHVCYLARKEL